MMRRKHCVGCGKRLDPRSQRRCRRCHGLHWALKRHRAAGKTKSKEST